MSETVAEFIYKTANPAIKDLARNRGHGAYINSFRSKAQIPEWRNKFERLMDNYAGTKFTFQQLHDWIMTDSIQPRYMDISLSLYESLKPHYPNRCRCFDGYQILNKL